MQYLRDGKTKSKKFGNPFVEIWKSRKCWKKSKTKTLFLVPAGFAKKHQISDLCHFYELLALLHIKINCVSFLIIWNAFGWLHCLFYEICPNSGLVLRFPTDSAVTKFWNFLIIFSQWFHNRLRAFLTANSSNFLNDMINSGIDSCILKK